MSQQNMKKWRDALIHLAGEISEIIGEDSSSIMSTNIQLPQIISSPVHPDFTGLFPSGEGWYISTYHKQPYPNSNSTPRAYWNQIHVGIDINRGGGNTDFDLPLYPMSLGRVIYVGGNRIWGNVVIIAFHNPRPKGPTLYARYAHLHRVLVKPDDKVAPGQVIGTIGAGDDGKGDFTAPIGRGRFEAHLHLEICKTDLFLSKPLIWHGDKADEIDRHYLDPLDLY